MFQEACRHLQCGVVSEHTKPSMSGCADQRCLPAMPADPGLVAVGGEVLTGPGHGNSGEASLVPCRFNQPIFRNRVFRKHLKNNHSIPCILLMLLRLQIFQANFSLSQQHIKEREVLIPLAAKSALAFKFKPKSSSVVVLQADPCRITANARPQ